MGAVFAMQGVGQFAAGLIALIVVAGFKDSLITAATVAQCDGVCGLAVDKMWRVMIGFGAVSIFCVPLSIFFWANELSRFLAAWPCIIDLRSRTRLDIPSMSLVMWPRPAPTSRLT